MTRKDLANLLGLGWEEVQTCNCDGYFYAYCEYTEKYHVFNSEGHEVAAFDWIMDAVRYYPQ